MYIRSFLACAFLSSIAFSPSANAEISPDVFVQVLAQRGVECSPHAPILVDTLLQEKFIELLNLFSVDSRLQSKFLLATLPLLMSVGSVHMFTESIDAFMNRPDITEDQRMELIIFQARGQDCLQKTMAGKSKFSWMPAVGVTAGVVAVIVGTYLLLRKKDGNKGSGSSSKPLSSDGAITTGATGTGSAMAGSGSVGAVVPPVATSKKSEVPSGSRAGSPVGDGKPKADDDSSKSGAAAGSSADGREKAPEVNQSVGRKISLSPVGSRPPSPTDSGFLSDPLSSVNRDKSGDDRVQVSPSPLASNGRSEIRTGDNSWNSSQFEHDISAQERANDVNHLGDSSKVVVSLEVHSPSSSTPETGTGDASLISSPPNGSGVLDQKGLFDNIVSPIPQMLPLINSPVSASEAVATSTNSLTSVVTATASASIVDVSALSTTEVVTVPNDGTGASVNSGDDATIATSSGTAQPQQSAVGAPVSAPEVVMTNTNSSVTATASASIVDVSALPTTEVTTVPNDGMGTHVGSGADTTTITSQLKQPVVAEPVSAPKVSMTDTNSSVTASASDSVVDVSALPTTMAIALEESEGNDSVGGDGMGSAAVSGQDNAFFGVTAGAGDKATGPSKESGDPSKEGQVNGGRRRNRRRNHVIQ